AADSIENPSTRVRAVANARKYATDNPGQAFYIEADIANLGGLNAARGSSGANTAYREIANRVKDALAAAGGRVIPFRHGGDEFSFVVVGADKAAVDAAVQQAKQAVARYTQEEGLADLPHSKAGRQTGVGVTLADTPITPDKTVQQILQDADKRLEILKKGDSNVPGSTIETAGPRPGTGGRPGSARAGDRSPDSRDRGTGRLRGEQPGLEQAVGAGSSRAQQRGAVPQDVGLPPPLQAAVDDQARLANKPRPKPVKRSTRSVQPQHDTLLEAVSKLTNERGERGLSRDAVRAEGIDPAAFNRRGHGINRVFTQNGMSLDEAAELLDGLGYPVRNEDGHYDPNALIDLIEQELAGNEVYSLARNPGDDFERQFMDHMETQFAQPVARAVSEEDALQRADDAPVPEETPRLLADEEYSAELLDGDTLQLDEDAKTLADLALLARRYDPDAVQSALESESDTTAARKLWRIIQRGQDDENTTQTQVNEREGAGAYLAGEPQEAGSANREETDLLGDDLRARQTLTDEQRRRDVKRNAGQESVETGDPNDLFSQARNQQPLFETDGNTRTIQGPQERDGVADPTGEAGRRTNAVPRQAQLELILPESSPIEAGELQPLIDRRVDLVQTGSAMGPAVIHNENDVAQIGYAFLQKAPQEQALTIIGDKDGRVLGVIRHHIGTTDSASVEISNLAGAVTDIPRAASVWFMHNHPSGNSNLSETDRRLDSRLKNIFDGTGIDYNGLHAVAGTGEYSNTNGIKRSRISSLNEEAGVAQTPRMEREFSAYADSGYSINSPEDSRQLRTSAQFKDATGVVLLDTRGSVVGFLPMPNEGMTQLRDNGSPNARHLLNALHKTNANKIMAFVGGNESDVNLRVGNNLTRFANAAQIQFLDAITADGRSFAESGYGGFSSDAAEGINFHSRGQGGGQTVSSLRAELQQALGTARVNKLEQANLLQLHDTSAALANGRQSTVPDDVQASFNGQRIGMVASNIRSGRGAGVFFHEAAHASKKEKAPGMQEMLGVKFDPLVARFKQLLDEGDKHAARAVARVPQDTPPELVDEERLAYLIEDVVNTPAAKREATFGTKVTALVRQAMNAIRAWFYASPFYKLAEKAGISMKL
ncbi:MAG TPA: JAB domain-containing protein, partial [Gammaproteobacteria bacterium]|nr:JAB domain-containing protein [Gammaproteobacteria bacterium]